MYCFFIRFFIFPFDTFFSPSNLMELNVLISPNYSFLSKVFHSPLHRPLESERVLIQFCKINSGKFAKLFDGIESSSFLAQKTHNTHMLISIGSLFRYKALWNKQKKNKPTVSCWHSHVQLEFSEVTSTLICYAYIWNAFEGLRE